MTPEASPPDPLDDPVGWFDPARREEVRRTALVQEERTVDPAEERIARLERTVETLNREVASLRGQRRSDEPAIEHAEWERRRYEVGRVVGISVLVVTVLVILATAAGR